MSTIRMSGMISGLDTESLVKELVNAQRLKNKKYTDKLTTSEWKEEKWKDLNTKLYKLYTDDLSKLRLSANYAAKKISVSNENLISVTGDNTAVNGAYTITDIKTASNHYITSGVVKTSDGTTTAKSINKLSDLVGDLGADEEVTLKLTDADGKETGSLKLKGSTTLAEVAFMMKNDLKLNANYDEKQGRLFISSTNGGISSRFGIEAGTEDKADDVLNALRLNIGGSDDTLNATVTQGSDSSIVVNGVTFTGTSNIITANGLTFNLKGSSTTGEKINFSVSNDVDATYNMVKDFLKNYNAILKEMNTLYYAASAKDYAPLSDDEKAEMSDDQVEKWETKIKDSILRRDSTLGSLIDSMKVAMTSSVEVPAGSGKFLSFANYGIQTSKDYTEKGLLHIAGDKDDAEYASATNKLMAALKDDPDTVITALSGVVKNVYDTVAKKMSSIPNVRSTFTFYNDKLMDSEQTALKKRIAELEDKLTNMEDRYYKQFTAMEKAMASMQSQSSALAGLLGNS